MTTSTLQTIQEIIAEALYVDIDTVTADANLTADLGAESIDFLDIVFRLEKSFAIKLPKGEIEQRVRGDLAGAEYEVNGVLQEKALERLRGIMPEINPAQISPGLRVKDIPSLFTVATFERMVMERLGAGATATTINHAATSGEAHAAL